MGIHTASIVQDILKKRTSQNFGLSSSGKLFWILLVDVVETFADFDRDACGRTDEFDAFDAACEENAKNVLPVLPILWAFLRHGLKAVEQDFKEFCVGGVGMLLAELLEKLGELFGFFEVGLGGVVMNDLIAFNIACDSGNGCIEVELDFGLVGHGGDEIELGFEKTNEACLLEVMICCERRLDIVALHENERTAIDE